MSAAPFKRITYPDYGSPVQHRRRRKLINGYRYDSANCVISPNGQLVFKRREGRKTVLVEGCNVRIYDSLRRLGNVVRLWTNRGANGGKSYG